MTQSDEQRIARLRSELAELEGRYAEAEARQGGRTAASARRGPISLIAVLLGVALAVGVVAAVDLRRLQSPTGTALAWTAAAVFGDCTAYRELSLRPAGGAGADQQCQELRRATERNRDRAGEVEIAVVEVQEQEAESSARVRLQRPGRPQAEVVVPMRRADDGWVVVLTDDLCAEVGCP